MIQITRKGILYENGAIVFPADFAVENLNAMNWSSERIPVHQQSQYKIPSVDGEPVTFFFFTKNNIKKSQDRERIWKMKFGID